MSLPNRRRKEDMMDAYAAGHEVTNHTTSHPNFVNPKRLSIPQTENQMERATEDLHLLVV